MTNSLSGLRTEFPDVNDVVADSSVPLSHISRRIPPLVSLSLMSKLAVDMQLRCTTILCHRGWRRRDPSNNGKLDGLPGRHVFMLLCQSIVWHGVIRSLKGNEYGRTMDDCRTLDPMCVHEMEAGDIRQPRYQATE